MHGSGQRVPCTFGAARARKRVARARWVCGFAHLACECAPKRLPLAFGLGGRVRRPTQPEPPHRGGSDAPRRHPRAMELPDGRWPGHGRGRDPVDGAMFAPHAARRLSLDGHEDAGIRRPDLAEWARRIDWEASASIPRDAPTRDIAPPSVSLPRFGPSAALWHDFLRPERPATRGLPDGDRCTSSLEPRSWRSAPAGVDPEALRFCDISRGSGIVGA